MRTILRILLLAAAIVAVPSIGHAGGWAVASLDPLPAFVPGEPATIGFRLLQHGVTPVHAAEWTDAEIGVAVRDAVGEHFVLATPSGAPGHYTATIDVSPEGGPLSLSVAMRNGLAVAEEWIDVPVGADAAVSAASTSDGWLPMWTVPVFALAAAACGGVLVIDARRRGGAPAA